MTMTIALRLIITEDGRVALQPLGWTSRNGSTTQCSRAELDRLVNAVIKGGEMAAESVVEHEAPPVPKTQPEHGMHEQIGGAGGREGRARAIEALRAIGLSAAEADLAVGECGIGRCIEVCKWVSEKIGIRDRKALTMSVLKKGGQ